jgi:nucleotide-binding universal stress UspA family protein
MAFPSRILVACDFQEVSDSAITHAISLAKACGASLVLLHAYQLPIYGFMDGSYVPTPEEVERIVNAGRKALDELAARVATSGCPVESALKNGNSAECIVETAKEKDCDLIVMGSHGRGLLARALVGSVAQNVLRLADRPVLIVRGASR